MKPSQLSIYETAASEQKDYEFILEEPILLENGIRVVREGVEQVVAPLQGTWSTVQDKWGIAKAHTGDLVNTIQEDPNILPRVGMISLAGLGGVIAGHRGGLMRKSVLCAAGILTASSLLYPAEAVDLTRNAYVGLKDKATEALGWNTSGFGTKSVSEQVQEHVSHVFKKEEANEETKGTPEGKGDPGQSNPEDKDMYTTREDDKK